MCDQDKKPFVPLAVAPVPTPAKGSRRKRLWDLPHSAHCPIVGVCVPLAALRRMMDKTFGGPSEFDDYHLHVGVVAQFTTRNLVSETLQRDLDRRFASALRAFSQAKTALAVGGLWRVSVEGGEYAAGLWAALTHPRCEPELCEQICCCGCVPSRSRKTPRSRTCAKNRACASRRRPICRRAWNSRTEWPSWPTGCSRCSAS